MIISSTRLVSVLSCRNICFKSDRCKVKQQKDFVCLFFIKKQFHALMMVSEKRSYGNPQKQGSHRTGGLSMSSIWRCHSDVNRTIYITIATFTPVCPSSIHLASGVSHTSLFYHVHSSKFWFLFFFEKNLKKGQMS